MYEPRDLKFKQVFFFYLAAKFAAVVDFPTPPLADETRMTFPTPSKDLFAGSFPAAAAAKPRRMMKFNFVMFSYFLEPVKSEITLSTHGDTRVI